MTFQAAAGSKKHYYYPSYRHLSPLCRIGISKLATLARTMLLFRMRIENYANEATRWSHWQNSKYR